MQELSVTSQGIDWLLMEIAWTKEGIKLSIRTNPRVEEFFKNLSAGNTNLVSLAGGKDWAQVGDEPISTYSIDEGTFHHASSFFMGYPSYPMYLDSFPNKVNLSFLHIVGASNGLSFMVKTPISRGGKKDLRMAMERGMQEFVREYLMFGKMVIRVSSFEA